MNDAQLLRYSRHILLDEIGIEGQARLLDARALVVGVGGLGSPAAIYLAVSGVGHLTLVDDDAVDATNLQRQILHGTADIGRRKVASGAASIAALNPEVVVRSIDERLAGDRLRSLVSDIDVVLDCSDNFATRHAVNRACVEAGRPLVSGAAARFDGQIMTFDRRAAQARSGVPSGVPCYACLFPEVNEHDAAECATFGVFAPLTGIIGAMQAAEAIKVLVGLPTLSGRMLLLDARAMEWHAVALAADPDCPVCGAGATPRAPLP